MQTGRVTEMARFARTGDPGRRFDRVLIPSVITFVVASLVAALDSVVDLPGWLVVVSLAGMALAACAFFAAAWRESRVTGRGLLRTVGSALWATVRLVLSFAF